MRHIRFVLVLLALAAIGSFDLLAHGQSGRYVVKDSEAVELLVVLDEVIVRWNELDHPTRMFMEISEKACPVILQILNDGILDRTLRAGQNHIDNEPEDASIVWDEAEFQFFVETEITAIEKLVSDAGLTISISRLDG